MKAKARANAIDRHISRRLQQARLERGITTRTAADVLGITSAQITHYETGVTRLAAGRLLPLARLYGRPVQWFFRGAPRG